MNAGKLTAGLILLAVGVLALVDTLDIGDMDKLWRYWPVALIILGIGSEVAAIRNRKSESGYVLIGIGLWFLIGTQRWFDLSWGRAFPVFVITVGLGVLLHALIDRPQAERPQKENAQ